MLTIVDCTFRDGGYYNDWDFPREVVSQYLVAMAEAKVDVVELGFRTFDNHEGFKGAFAFTTDEMLNTLEVPPSLQIGVMANASDLLNHPLGPVEAAKLLFSPAANSPVTLVRLACHVDEFKPALELCSFLKELGYRVGINLMQIADRSLDEITKLAELACGFPIDVLYFADSLGGLSPDQTGEIVKAIRKSWSGEIGIHTHDNMGRALANTVRAIDVGATWVDCTVTGMGRGPGNAQTEYVLLELDERRNKQTNIIPLLDLQKSFFYPLKTKCGWGMNPYYYLAGKQGIHPTYIQEMLSDTRYKAEDILTVIDRLKGSNGKKFSFNNLEDSRNHFAGTPVGTWSPNEEIKGRDVLILGAGPSGAIHKAGIETYIRKNQPYVIALNTVTSIDSSLIDARASCHPVRVLADCSDHMSSPNPLITPASMLPVEVSKALSGKSLKDFGIRTSAEKFTFSDRHAEAPSTLVIAYALAISTSGQANRIFLAGFDGYPAGDPRNNEMTKVFTTYSDSPQSLPIVSITPTTYPVHKSSVYAL